MSGAGSVEGTEGPADRRAAVDEGDPCTRALETTCDPSDTCSARPGWRRGGCPSPPPQTKVESALCSTRSRLSRSALSSRALSASTGSPVASRRRRPEVPSRWRPLWWRSTRRGFPQVSPDDAGWPLSPRICTRCRSATWNSEHAVAPAGEARGRLPHRLGCLHHVRRGLLPAGAGPGVTPTNFDVWHSADVTVEPGSQSGKRVGDTRTRIVATAVTLLGRRGTAGTTIEAVLARSGAPRGSVYHHFPGGRDEIVTDAVPFAGEEVAGFIDRDIGPARRCADWLPSGRRTSRRPISGRVVPSSLWPSGTPTRSSTPTHWSPTFRAVAHAVRHHGDQPRLRAVSCGSDGHAVDRCPGGSRRAVPR